MPFLARSGARGSPIGKGDSLIGKGDKEARRTQQGWSFREIGWLRQGVAHHEMAERTVIAFEPGYELTRWADSQQRRWIITPTEYT